MSWSLQPVYIPTSPNNLAVLENGDVVKSKAKENGNIHVRGGEEWEED